MTTDPNQPIRPQDSAQDGSASPDSAGSSSLPKLGDFSKLYKLAEAFKPAPSEPSLVSRVSGTDRPGSLGDFSKIRDRLPSAAHVGPRPTGPAKTAPIEILHRPRRPNTTESAVEKSHRKVPSSATATESDSPATSGLDTDPETDSTYSTPASSPSSSVDKESSHLGKFAKAKAKAKAKAAATSKSARPQPVVRHAPVHETHPQVQAQLQSHSQPQLVFSYQLYNYGPLTGIYDHLPTEQEQHKSLIHRLVREHLVDTKLRVNYPILHKNGIHVFVDMSNIMISFHKALRAKYSLHESVRLVPLPLLNVSFFTELLVRGRETKVLNAGCSMHPNRSEPGYVNDLRRIGYRVDLRCRQQENAHDPLASGYNASGRTRYVEDMVDETLQTRIGESVMQYFDARGTLVIATGDARPAKFSDGFFTYAHRALKMGWDVEVVSWRSSLSGAWTNPTWVASWGHRFRVIQLDDYLDDLLQCATH